MTTIATDTFTFPTAVSSGSATSATKTADIMGKQDFLTLLVAQLRNQDPLNPDDPTEFTAQLAQFSALEQLYNLNESMTGLTTAQSNASKLSALNLIGKEVSYNGATFAYDASPIAVGYQLDGVAAGVTLSLQDVGGRTVKTLEAPATELTAGNHFLTWDGTDHNGNPVAAGTYRIVLAARAAGVNSSIAAAPLISSEVTGVNLSTGMLSTRAGEVLFNNLIRVTEPWGANQGVTTTSTGSSDILADTGAITGTVDTSTAETTAATVDGQSAEEIINNFIQQLQP